MTHLGWAPPEWQDAARETLAGLAELHPSRTILLFPQEGGRDALDADVSLQCYSLPELERHVCSEVIELRLHGTLANSPASVVLPLVLPDLPVFLRWRGRPAFGSPAFEQLVDVVDRLVVDSREWEDVPSSYPELVPYFERVAISDIVWGRTLALAPCDRGAVARRFASADQLHVRGPLPRHAAPRVARVATRPRDRAATRAGRARRAARDRRQRGASRARSAPPRATCSRTSSTASRGTRSTRRLSLRLDRRTSAAPRRCGSGPTTTCTARSAGAAS